MGIYASATLFYGYWLGDDIGLEDEDGEMLDIDVLTERTAIAEGHVNPWDNYPDNEGMSYEEFERIRTAWEAEHDGELDAWHDTLREIERRSNVEITTHGDYRWPAYCASIKGTETTGWSGEPTAIDGLTKSRDWDSQLQDYLTTLGIDLPEGHNQPGWWLIASYG